MGNNKNVLAALRLSFTRVISYFLPSSHVISLGMSSPSFENSASTSTYTLLLNVITSYYKVVVFIDPLQGLHNY